MVPSDMPGEKFKLFRLPDFFYPVVYKIRFVQLSRAVHMFSRVVKMLDSLLSCPIQKLHKVVPSLHLTSRTQDDFASGVQRTENARCYSSSLVNNAIVVKTAKLL